MKRSSLFLALVFLGGASHATEIAYRGTLYAHGQPANGLHTLRVTPYATQDSLVPLAPAAVVHGLDIANGALETTLNFSSLGPDRTEVWLRIEAAAADSGFQTLPGRELVSLKAAGACWSTSGNAGTDDTVDFIGTTDDEDLAFRVNGVLAAQFASSSAPDGPNILLGANTVSTDSISGLVAGGRNNAVGGEGSTVVGGSGNYAGTPLDDSDSSNFATVIGGGNNSAIGVSSIVLGGLDNQAIGPVSFAAGLGNCAGGTFSIALGRNATVRPGNVGQQCNSFQGNSGDDEGDQNSFVWSDGSEFASSGDGQFLIHAYGGVGINTSSSAFLSPTELAVKGVPGSPADMLMISGETPAQGIAAVTHRVKSSGTDSNNVALSFHREFYSLGVLKTDLAEFGPTGRFRVFVDNPIKPTAGGWSAPSDERLKTDIHPLAAGTLDRLLDLQGVKFNYRIDAPSGYYVAGEHTGFVAQAVERVFPEWVSTDSSGYKLVGPKGFEALTVEALRELRAEKDQEIAALKLEHAKELANLAARLDAMASTVAALQSNANATTVAHSDGR